MELKILEEKKNKLVIEVKGETHTFCNAMKKELWNDKHIKAAAYTVSHPFAGVPKLMVETDGSETPKKALLDAAKRIEKEFDSFKSEFSKAAR